MSDHLFVYGTLLSGLVAPTIAPLMTRLTFEGPASLAGEMFDLGAYPAVLPGGESMVHGELYALPADPTILAMLDHYEGHFPDRPHQSLFRRTRVQVSRGDGRVVHAWIYAWNKPTPDATRIVDGDYRATRRSARTA